MTDDPKQIIALPAGARRRRSTTGAGCSANLHARFRTGSFVKGLELVNRIGEAAEEANHHPDVDLTYPHARRRLVSHDVGGVTSRDLDLARRISEIAAELGVEAAPREISALELALDVPDAEDGHAVLGGGARLRGRAATAGRSRTPAAGARPCGSRSSEARRGRSQQRFHSTSSCRSEVAAGADRRRAVAAGGTLVSDDAGAGVLGARRPRTATRPASAPPEGRDGYRQQ